MITENNEVVTDEQTEIAIQEASQILLDGEEKLRTAEQRLLEAKQKLKDTEQKLEETKQKAREILAKNLFKTGKSSKEISRATGIPVSELTRISRILNK